MLSLCLPSSLTTNLPCYGSNITDHTIIIFHFCSGAQRHINYHTFWDMYVLTLMLTPNRYEILHGWVRASLCNCSAVLRKLKSMLNLCEFNERNSQIQEHNCSILIPKLITNTLIRHTLVCVAWKVLKTTGFD